MPPGSGGGPADVAPCAGPDPEAAYFQAVEEFFVSRRGEPLILSSADWNLVRRWRTAGIPLRVVLRGIADALDAHAVSWSRGRRVGSLAYCAPEVAAAHERWERALALGGPEAPSTPDLLLALARALETARRSSRLGPHSEAIARGLARELEERATSPCSPRELEGWLVEREGEFFEALRSEVGGEWLAAEEAAIDRDLAPYRGRMPARVVEQIRRESLRRRLLESRGLPRLSLFHAAAGA